MKPNKGRLANELNVETVKFPQARKTQKSIDRSKSLRSNDLSDNMGENVSKSKTLRDVNKGSVDENDGVQSERFVQN